MAFDADPGLIMAAPLFGNVSVPAQVKIGLGIMLTLIVGAHSNQLASGGSDVAYRPADSRPAVRYRAGDGLRDAHRFRSSGNGRRNYWNERWGSVSPHFLIRSHKGSQVQLVNSCTAGHDGFFWR